MRRGGLTREAAVLLVDKPAGPTSHDVVAAARGALGVRRIGHTGTLDPFASGLLILCVGRATRLVEYFHLLAKSYDATIRLGERRETDDLTGEVVARSESWRGLSDDDIASALATDLGELFQRPPVYSALRRDGRRAHEAARAGEVLDIPARRVRVDEATILDRNDSRLRVRYTVSTGTYIRALARDLGERLGCHAHLASLRRTAIGPFAVGRAAGPDELGALVHTGSVASDPPAWLLTPLEALDWLPRSALRPAEVVEISHGRDIPDTATAAPPGQCVEPHDLPVVLHDEAGGLVAVARRDDGRLRPEKVFRAG